MTAGKIRGPLAIAIAGLGGQVEANQKTEPLKSTGNNSGKKRAVHAATARQTPGAGAFTGQCKGHK